MGERRFELVRTVAATLKTTRFGACWCRARRRVREHRARTATGARLLRAADAGVAPAGIAVLAPLNRRSVGAAARRRDRAHGEGVPDYRH